MSSRFNTYIGSWEVQNVEDMDHMFDGASNFDQNLTCWNVEEHFDSAPKDFAARSAMAADHVPLWGRAPSIGCSDTSIPQGPDSFSFDVIVPQEDLTFTWPIRLNSDVPIDCTVHWGDGTSDNISSKTSGAWIHHYTTPGSKSLAITGRCSAPVFEDYPVSATKIYNISNWGNLIGATDWSGAFSGCFRLAYIVASDSFGTGVTSTAGMFYDCRSFTGNKTMETWVLDDVTDASYMFWNCDSFNRDVSGWNTASVQDMTGMFGNDSAGVSIFDQDLSSWSTDSVTSIDLMFKNAGNFNSYIGNWNVSGIESPSGIWHALDGATSFNQNLTCWDVSRLTTQVLAAAGITDATTFAAGSGMMPNKKPRWGLSPNFGCDTNPLIVEVINESTYPIQFLARDQLSVYDINWGDGSTDRVTYNPDVDAEVPVLSHSYGDVGSTYQVSISGIGGPPYFGVFDPYVLIDILQWGSITGATDWSGAFEDCYGLTSLSATDAIQPGVTNMSSMFAGCSGFNSSLANWNVESVENFSRMFEYCQNFNQDLDSWNPISAVDMSYMFHNASVFNGKVDNWNLSNVVTLEGMFMFPDWDRGYEYDNKFNRSLSTWTTTNKLKNISYMFATNSTFNQSVNSLNVSGVENMTRLFSDALKFNQPLNNWDTSSCTNMSGMFTNNNVFNQYIGNWNVSSVLTFDFMFNGTNVFNQNLSCWNVATNPSHVGFYDYNTQMPSEYFPKWGQTPNTGCS